MSPTGFRNGKANGLALLLAAGFAIMTALGTTNDTMVARGSGAAALCAVNQQSEGDLANLDADGTMDSCPQQDLLEPAAICRLRPECSTNEECDAICGAGLGKCVHSNCPVRICRCR